jgi:predicted  nucleic acid-binding Zn-ribbon protein
MASVAREQADFDKAEQDIRDGEARIEQQRRLIDDLRRDGHETVEAEKLLWALQQSLDAWRAHRDTIRTLLADAKKRAGERNGGG